jgi:hypothetical protein
MESISYQESILLRLTKSSYFYRRRLYDGAVMGRVSADLRPQDRSARARLRPRRNAYWRMICDGQHPGYYKGARGSTWIVRYRSQTTARCGIKMSLGTADDVAEANGETILSWKQALDKVMHWLELQEKGGPRPPSTPTSPSPRPSNPMSPCATPGAQRRPGAKSVRTPPTSWALM